MSTQPVDYSQLLNNVPGYSPQPYGNPYANMGVDYSQSSPSYAMKQNRGLFANWGQQFDQNLSDNEDQQNQYQNAYRGVMNQQAAQMGQNPGYTTDEYGNITREPQYQQGITSPSQYASLTPSQQEAAGMQGNPQNYGSYFDPSVAGMQSNVKNVGDQTSAATQNAYSGMGTAIGNEATSYNQIAGNSNLSPQSAYFEAMNNAYTGARSGVQGAIDPSKLSLDLDRNKYVMSDADVNNMTAQAGNTARLARQGAMDDINRAAVASGSADPMALAALRTRYQRQGDVSAADAETSARLQAQDAQRQQMMGYAQASLGANQNYAGLASNAQLALGNMGANVANQAEQTNLGAAQYNANLQNQQAGNVANQAIGMNQWMGQQGAANAQNLGSMYQNALQYIGTQGTGINEASDQAAAQRAANLYGIRQGNTQYGQQNAYNQNFQTNQQLSNVYQNAANARMNGQNNLLNWSTGQTNAAQQAGAGYAGQRIQTAQTTFPQINQATGQWGTYDQQAANSGFAGSFKNSLGSALGKTLGSFGMQQGSDSNGNSHSSYGMGG